MDIRFIILLILLFVPKLSLAQEPSELLNIRFNDANGEIIYPELTIIETDIKPFRSGKNSKDWGKLKIEEDTLVIKDLTENYSRWSRIDSTGYYLSPLKYSHYLSEEIKIIAKHNSKKMTITFIGQGMSNFGCWGNDMNPSSLLDITLEEGCFLYVKTDAFRKTNSSDSVASPLFKGSVSCSFKMIEKLTEIDPIENFKGISFNGQILPLNEILALNSVYYGQASYNGFLFENNIPVGFALIVNEIAKAYLFNEKYQQEIKKVLPF